MNARVSGATVALAALALGGCPGIELPQINPANRVPQANAGPDVSAQVGQRVTLDASGSTDPDGDSLSYSWTQTSGPPASLGNANQVQASFTPAQEGLYEFTVTVTDGRGGSSSDTVRVSVTAGEEGGGGGGGAGGGGGGGGAGGGDNADGGARGGGTIPPPGASLTLAVTAHPDPVRPGDTTSYQIVVGNNGQRDLYQVKVSTPKLASWYGFYENSQGADCDADGEIEGGEFCNTGEIATWSIGDFPAGSTRAIAFAPQVYSYDVPDLTTIQVVVTATSLEGASASATRTVTVRTNPPLGLAATADRSFGSIGAEIRFTLDFRTASAGTLQNPTLRATLPEGTEFVSANEGGQAVGGRVEWALPQLGPGSVGSRQFSVRVVGPLPAGSLILTEVELTGTLFISGQSSSQAARAQAVVPVQ